MSRGSGRIGRLKAMGLFFVALAAGVAGAIVSGTLRWRARTKGLRAKIGAARRPARAARYDAKEIESLPAPVARYFRAALQHGQPIVLEARFTHEGQFRMKEPEGKWRPFTSDQMATTQPPGFDWNARMPMAPGFTVFVHDAYVGGEGMLHAEALGLVTLADVRGTAAAAEGELLRYFAEAAWYPTALLPSQGVRWEAVGDLVARATLVDGATTVSLEFRFGPEGLIASVRAASRYRGDRDGIPQFAPWEGRFWGYEVRHGMRIPLEAEVAWHLPGGSWPYWRGRITKIGYEFARSDDRVG